MAAERRTVPVRQPSLLFVLHTLCYRVSMQASPGMVRGASQNYTKLLVACKVTKVTKVTRNNTLNRVHV